MKTYNIKIAGEGTREEIAKQLRDIANAIHNPTSKGDGYNVGIDSVDGAEWEEKTLITEIHES